MPSPIKQGWGLTHDDSFIYLSDGTATIYKINATNFSIISSIKVVDSVGTGIIYLNEIEMFNNTYIFANQFTTNYIYKIDIKTGKAVASYNLYNLFLT